MSYSTNPQQEAIKPHKSVWVNASAGSGKTKTLTDRVIALLLSGVKPSSIMCLTFTKAAAKEMLHRVKASLKKWSVEKDQMKLKQELSYYLDTVSDEDCLRARCLFLDLIDDPYKNLNIDTMHSFCQGLLGQFPFEAGISPAFQILSEQDSQLLLQKALSKVFQSQLSEIRSQTSDFYTISKYIHEVNFFPFLKRIVNEFHKIESVIQKFDTKEALSSAILDRLGMAYCKTEDQLISEFHQYVAEYERDYQDLAEDLQSGSKTDQQKSEFLKQYFVEGKEKDPLSLMSFFLTADQTIRKSIVTKSWLKKHPHYEDWLWEQADHIKNWLDQYHSQIIYQATMAVYGFAFEVSQVYRLAKEEENALDYNDLIEKSLALFQDPSAAHWILYKLDQNIDHILVDEAQDTNPNQWQLVKLLCEDFLSGLSNERDKSLFIVGDAKQSIYRFQGADIAIYHEIKSYFEQGFQRAGQDWDSIDLPKNYRSQPEILAFVDQTIREITPQGLGLEDAQAVRHIPHKTSAQPVVEVWPIYEAEPDDTPQAWKPPVEREASDSARKRLALDIVDKISHLLADQTNGIEPKDIMILVRHRTGFVDELTRLLKQNHIPVMGADRFSLNEQIVIQDLLAFAKFVLLPSDDLNLAVLLKSPFCNWSEEELFDLAIQRDEKSLWEGLQAEKYQETYTYLSSLLDLDTETLWSFFYQALSRPCLKYASGKEALMTRLGVDVEDPLQEFLHLVYEYEQKQLPSLQHFVHWFERQEYVIKRQSSEDTNEVRIMTIHGAKGLQSKVVFLPDTIQKPKASESLLWDDEGLLFWVPKKSFHNQITEVLFEEWKAGLESEYYRLLYVALTRAEDQLYIAGYSSKQSPAKDCWYEILQSAYQNGKAEPNKQVA